MSHKPATPQEMKECRELYKGILSAMDGKDYDAILNTLCFIMAELGVELDLTKQRFIAKTVERISSAYDMHKLLGAEPEGEA